MHLVTFERREAQAERKSESRRSGTLGDAALGFEALEGTAPGARRLGAILTEGSLIEPDSLLLRVRQGDSNRSGAAPRDSSQTLADVERNAIERALAETKGNRKQAAELLGIGLRTLYDKLKKYELS